MDTDSCTTAVEFKNVWKSYGIRKNKNVVLQGVNIDVPTGSIYGLLGPSGCGKTTILRCIVGRLHVDSGKVKVFNKTPGSSSCNIPGADVGYMPQELALFRELTIKETWRYFGRINSMDSKKVKSRSEFLLNFLNLPEDWQQINNLSGGQQRRVSFAVALLHEPPLLILDEPTVGVDPLLRENIWQHLIEISNAGNVTIIITTHYIEEARQAHKVGFMRNGSILSEAQPNLLLQRFNMASLEGVFLRLCQNNNDVSTPGLQSEEVEENENTENEEDLDPMDKPLIPFEDKACGCSVKIRQHFNKIQGLVFKTLIRMTRNIGFLLFQFLIPSVQIVLFCFAIGGDPKHLNIAVCNKDQGYLGKKYLEYIDTSIVNQVNVSSVDEGVNLVLHQKAWGILNIGRNFSLDLFERVLNPTNISSDVIEGGSVHIRLDMTDQQIGFTLQKVFLDAFQQFVYANAGNQSQLFSIPVKYGDPIYGEASPQYTEYLSPGILLTVTFFMAVGLTALSFVLEKKEGLLERSYVSGVTSGDIIIAHLITQFGIVIIQTALSLIFLILIFRLPSQGPIVWVIIITLLQGMCGMCFGFLISTICDQENTAIMVSLSFFYPSLLLSGIVWPFEAIPTFLQYISICLPQTYPTESVRSIMSRGLGIASPEVYTGVLITLAWILIFLLVSAFCMKLKH